VSFACLLLVEFSGRVGSGVGQLIPYRSSFEAWQKAGLINREPNPADARSTMVCLLPVGRDAIEKAAPGHVADVRRVFLDLLTPAELDQLTILPERILHHLVTPADSDSSSADDPS